MFSAISIQHFAVISLLQCFGSLGSHIAGRFSTSDINDSRSIALVTNLTAI